MDFKLVATFTNYCNTTKLNKNNLHCLYCNDTVVYGLNNPITDKSWKKLVKDLLLKTNCSWKHYSSALFYYLSFLKQP